MATLADLETAITALTTAVSDLAARVAAPSVPQADVDAVNAATAQVNALAPPA